MKQFSKKITLLSLPLALGVLILLSFNKDKFSRIYHVLNLFDEDRIVENFRSMNEHFPYLPMVAATDPYIYENGAPYHIPKSFPYDEAELKTDFFLKGSKTTGLLIIKKNKIVFEEYYLGNTPTTQNISWSMAKSFVSTMIGIAYDEGLIIDLDQAVETLAPQLKGTAYEGVTIKNVLEMSTGVAFNEDYGDFFSDINKWGRAFAWGSSQDEFVATLIREKPQGTYHHYVSIDTHVLSMVLREVTGQSLTDYMQEKLWNPLGMEFDGYWATDDQGTEVALCGLNATLRDYGKLGSLYLNKGFWNGQQIIPEAWVEASVNPSGPHLLPGKNNPNSAHELGYGYQWWIPEGNEGEFLAQGVYNQNIYVNPSKDLVIVKLSANDRFNQVDYLPSQWQVAMAFYRKISNNL